jgi:hypothetical protein
MPELERIADDLSASLDRIENLRALWRARSADIQRLREGIASSISIGEALLKDVRTLQAKVERGQGSVGAFLKDREIFDDLHDTHGILKSQPWQLIVKPDKNARRR